MQELEGDKYMWFWSLALQDKHEFIENGIEHSKQVGSQVSLVKFEQLSILVLIAKTFFEAQPAARMMSVPGIFLKPLYHISIFCSGIK